MCLIVVAHEVSKTYALLLAANRDERHDRPSADTDWWPDAPTVLGGRDLVAGGSWLALNRAGRLAAVTNVAEPGIAAAPRSRGDIVKQYVISREPATSAARVAAACNEYGPFNALLLDAGKLSYLSNRAAGRTLAAGIHSLSNAALGADWPKLAAADKGMGAALNSASPREALFELLAQRAPASAEPSRYRESLFIVGPEYGTRASTVVLIDRDGRVEFSERRFDRDGRATGTSHFEFALATTGASVS